MAKGCFFTNITDFFKLLFEKANFSGVLGLRKRGDKAFYCLFTDETQLSGFDPFYPVMPQSGARAVSQLTFSEPSPFRVAVVMRPCELRAVFELAKLDQVKLENLLLVGIECSGVWSFDTVFRQARASELYDGYLKTASSGEDPELIRETCKGCEWIYPDGADVVISWIGRQSPTFIFKTKKALEVAESIGISFEDIEPEKTEALVKMGQRRMEYSKKLCSEIRETAAGVENLISVFETCILCRNCSRVCPLCYCRDCFFDSSAFDYEPESYERRLLKKGTFKAPLDTLLFHLGRMTHMALSCVSCGMCEDACPVEIPVARIFRLVGKDLRELFEYEPGRSLEEPLPLTVFEHDELHEVEDK